MTDLVVARSREELRAALDPLHDAGTVALVPTMGALHAGHRSLMARARSLADAVVVSIFVNPLQFGPGDDLSRYPRTMHDDLVACAAEGVAVVFAPGVDVMYPMGHPSVTVDAGPLGDVLEGAIRPGHYDGVLTVVAKLFGIVRPDVAVFGEKDAQQLALVRRMVADLDLPVRIEAAPTVRTPDGLALSSRNTYLDSDGARHALALSRALAAAEESAQSGSLATVAAARAVLDAEPDLAVDYCVLVDPATFEPLGPGRDLSATGLARILVAARVGGTRLIDTAIVSLPDVRPAVRLAEGERT